MVLIGNWLTDEVTVILSCSTDIDVSSTYKEYQC